MIFYNIINHKPTIQLFNQAVFCTMADFSHSIMDILIVLVYLCGLLYCTIQQGTVFCSLVMLNTLLNALKALDTIGYNLNIC